MAKKKNRAERFDDAFKMLLIVMSITYSASIAFFREVMEPKFFSYSGGFFVLTIVLWTFATLYDGDVGCILKILAWYFLMMGYGTIYARLQYNVFLLPALVISIITLVALALTLPIIMYLKKNIPEKDYRLLMKGFPLITLLFIILDVLYFLGLISFPL